jgi:hypothetical protein
MTFETPKISWVLLRCPKNGTPQLSQATRRWTPACPNCRHVRLPRTAEPLGRTVPRRRPLEREMIRFGSADYEFETDLNNRAEMARRTLALKEENRQSILTRPRIRQRRQ